MFPAGMLHQALALDMQRETIGISHESHAHGKKCIEFLGGTVFFHANYGGVARGIMLKSVDEIILRPATDYLRQAVFSSLGDVIIGIKFLDIFAGIGGYGLEALSRGAPGGFSLKITTKLPMFCEKI
jgi:hypothetical protein